MHVIKVALLRVSVLFFLPLDGSACLKHFNGTVHSQYAFSDLPQQCFFPECKEIIIVNHCHLHRKIYSAPKAGYWGEDLFFLGLQLFQSKMYVAFPS